MKSLDITLAQSGFYKGFNNTVAFSSKIIIALIVVSGPLSIPSLLEKCLGT
jgi:hypothetical protein